MNKTVAIIGAGPAGLTAAYLLAKNNISVLVIEQDPEYVGGISRTAKYKGFLFDIGGHRFFSKSKEVEDFWTEILPKDMLDRPRSSRIYFRGKFLTYPLKPIEALLKLGPIESIMCVLDYLKARLFPIKNPTTFEQWVTNQFGRRLFENFFKTYTEKVWGMSCKEISADWAAQRISGLSLFSAIKNAILGSLLKRRSTHRVIKTLIDSFRYPRRGPGMMWEVCAQKFVAMGGDLRMGLKVVECQFDEASDVWNVKTLDSTGKSLIFNAQHLISTAPMRSLVKCLGSAVSQNIQTVSETLKYRDFLTVMLILKDRGAFADNWIYIHDPSAVVGRIQNFKSWSPEMVPDKDLTCYGLEYFCNAGDGLWNSSDSDLLSLARKEIVALKLAKDEDILDGCVVRQPKAYPVYDTGYSERVLETQVSHLPN